MLGLAIDSMGATELQNNITTVFQAEMEYAERFFEEKENILYPKNNKDIEQLLSNRRYMPTAMVDDTFIKDLTQNFPDVKYYSERTEDSRTLLTNALDTVAQTDQEKELLAE